MKGGREVDKVYQLLLFHEAFDDSQVLSNNLWPYVHFMSPTFSFTVFIIIV